MSVDGSVSSEWRCDRAARWLPRTLAAAVLVASGVIGWGLDPAGSVPGSRMFRLGLLGGAGVIALWIVRTGAELGAGVRLEPDALVYRHRSREARLPLEEIDTIGYQAPFSVSRTWVAATVAVDREGRGWRLPAFLKDGGGLIEALLDRAQRGDLNAWSESLALPARMNRVGVRVGTGYSVATLIVGAAIWVAAA